MSEATSVDADEESSDDDSDNGNIQDYSFVDDESV